jgi:glycosyltransferase involved in cell wall biosynthesis
MTPELSVVLCTRDRIEVLQRSLGLLLEQSCRARWQLVVVDNGSSDGTARWLGSISAVSGMSLEVLGEPRPGVCRAKNAGLAAAKGDILAFIDDDCYVCGSYLDDVLDVFDSPDVGYMGGRVLLHDPADMPITIRESTEPLRIPPRSFVRAGLLHGANMAFRREAIEAIGGFDVLLGPGAPLRSGDDTDVQARVSAAGYAGVYAPTPTVRHHHGRRDLEVVDRLVYGYDLGRGAHYLKSLVRPPTTVATALEWVRSVDLFSRMGIRRILAEIGGAGLYLALRLRALVRPERR